MTTVTKLLGLFNDAIVGAMINAPDAFPDWSAWTYETSKADLLDLWSKTQPLLKRDFDQADVIGQKLTEAFKAFDEEGDKLKGRQSLLDIYNLEIKKLR